MTNHQIFCSASDILADKESGDEARLYQSARDASRFLEEEIGWFIPVSQTTQMRGNGKQYLYPHPPILSLTGSITVESDALTEGTDFVFMRQMWANGPYLGMERLSDAPNFSDWCAQDADSIQIPCTVGLYSRTVGTDTTLSANMTDSATSMLVDNGAKVSPGMIVEIDSEKMLITGWGDPTEEVAYLDGALAVNAEQVSLDDATDLNAGEIIRVTFEQMKIKEKRQDLLSLKRSWNGSGKAAHADLDPVDVYRTVTLERAINGTTAAAHTSGASITRYVPPDDIRFLAVEIATLMVNKAASGFQGRIGKADLGETFYNDAFPQYDIERIKMNYWIGKI